MTSFLYLLLGTFVALLASRWYKNPRMYVTLLCTLLLGFVVGTEVKDVVANTSSTSTQELVITASNPTVLDTSTAVVETVDEFTFIEPSKEMKSDTVLTNNEKLPNRANLSEIEDDS